MLALTAPMPLGSVPLARSLCRAAQGRTGLHALYRGLAEPSISSMTLLSAHGRQFMAHLEITEGVMMTDPQLIIDTLGALRQLGVKVNLDDFGTGYSSLSYLHRLPADALKIDRSFIDRIVEHGVHLEIARTIVALGHRLDLTVIAEGVETTEHLNCLRELSCEYAQGYLFSRPMTPADAEAYLIRMAQPVSPQIAVAAAAAGSS